MQLLLRQLENRPVDDDSCRPVPLDLAQLQRRCMGKIELVERLLASFERRFPLELVELGQALAEGNVARVGQLAHQLKGAAALYVQVGSQQDATGLLSQVGGVRMVTVADRHDEFVGYEIEAEPNRDIRIDVARAVVNGGLGLLELRPMRMSLEEIFLQLTTEDQPAAPDAAVNAAAAPAGSGAANA